MVFLFLIFDNGVYSLTVEHTPDKRGGDGANPSKPICFLFLVSSCIWFDRFCLLNPIRNVASVHFMIYLMWIESLFFY